MFCENCGNEIKAGMKFCTKCGIALAGDTSKMQEVMQSKKQSVSVKKWMIGIIAVAIVVIGIIVALFVSGRTPSISEAQILEMLNNRSYPSVEIAGWTYSVTFESVDSIAQEWNKEREVLTVACDVKVSNDDMRADLRCQINCYEIEHDNWAMWEPIVESYSMQPLKGAEEPGLFVDEVVKGLYPELNWDGGEYYSIFGEPSSEILLGWTLEEHNTNLDNKTDQFIYEYTFNSFTTHVKGKIALNYIFDDSGQWVYQSATQLSDDRTWNLEGIWSFDIFTYYIDVAIVEMNWEEQVATLQRRGGILKGSGDVETIQVGFQEENGCIYFDTFVIPSTSYGSSDKEVTLTAKFDDLYYKSPSVFAGADPVDMAIGGKSE